MSKLNSIASSKVWQKVPKEKRSEIMRARVLSRWSKTTKEQRRAYALKLVEARRKKVCEQQ